MLYFPYSRANNTEEYFYYKQECSSLFHLSLDICLSSVLASQRRIIANCTFSDHVIVVVEKFKVV